MTIPVANFIFPTLGLIMIAWGIFQGKKGTHLLKVGKKAKTVVLDNINWDRGGTSGPSFPVVKFQTEKLEWVTKQLSTSSGPSWKIGTELDVIYDPNEPTKVEPYSYFALKILPKLLVGMGVLALVLGILEWESIP